MTGKQKMYYDALLELVNKIGGGFYGEGDDIDEDAFDEDVGESLSDPEDDDILGLNGP